MRRDEIATLLPEVIRRTLREGSPLAALLEVMESLHTPSEEILADLPSRFNPLTTSSGMVEYLAGWVDLGWILDESTEKGMDRRPGSEPMSSGIGRLRELVAASAGLGKELGTRQGIVRFLETATGLTGFSIEETTRDEEGRVVPFHVRIDAPSAALPHRRLIRRIIEMEKPAHVTFELSFRGSRSGDGE